jgi:hypothetical protein
MTALPYTDWAILCDGTESDGRPCPAQERTDTLDMRDGSTSADVRKVLKRRGWTVGVRTSEPADGRMPRRDYCPQHKRTEEKQ